MDNFSINKNNNFLLESYDELINFWDNVYGFNMKTMKSEVLNEPFIDTVAVEKVLTDPVQLTEIDLNTCTVDSCQFSSKFSLEAKRDGVLTSLAGYFDVFFDLSNQVFFSTGPHSKKTHWQQSIFYLHKPLQLKQGM